MSVMLEEEVEELDGKTVSIYGVDVRLYFVIKGDQVAHRWYVLFLC